ncbi:Emcn [Lemmus lemmus]
MRLLQVTALLLLLCNRLCRSEDSEDVQDKSTPSLPTTSTTKSSVTTSGSVSVTNPNNTKDGPSPTGITNGELFKGLLTPAPNSLTTVKHEAENQSSIKTPEVPGTTQPPDASPKTTTSPLASLTTPETISQLQDTEDGKITATPSSNLSYSYSSVILPVVIALIVITLLVFTLVGLYRMCWKRDPGAPENGNDQPQSDKESVKLLTVKTISHESGR